MKTAVVLCALFACANAGLISGLLGTIHENFIDPLLGSAQQTAQDLLETYTPILGQTAQQLTGSVVQGVGGVLTDWGIVDEQTVMETGQSLQETVGQTIDGIGDGLNTLVSGRKRQIEFQTEIGQILHDGVMDLLEHTTQTIQNVQQSITGAINTVFGEQPATKGIRVSMKGIQIVGKQGLKLKAKKLLKQLSNAVSKERRARGFFDDLASTTAAVFQPAIDAASQAFNQLVDAATIVGQQVLDHGSTLVNNVQAQLQQTYREYRTDISISYFLSVFH
ncbi:Hypp3224 [Branchiostoma lanceolatum]|uniref:Hypp3224 protein n=1 Tax=Branchiostoma lanceolatum TaxID=7740 RepID=A0A8K0A194_BRALA|nr:Hypp3224 [Branchiostoma lanceolatum]